VVGGVGPLPVRIDTAGAAGQPATGQTWDALGELAAAQGDPPSDTHGSGQYRKRLTATLVARAPAPAAGERPPPPPAGRARTAAGSARPSPARRPAGCCRAGAGSWAT